METIRDQWWPEVGRKGEIGDHRGFLGHIVCGSYGTLLVDTCYKFVKTHRRYTKCEL